MTRPAKVKIGHVTLNVACGPKTTADLDRDGEQAGKYMYGDSSFRDARIRVRHGLAPDIEVETLLHEVLHMAYAVGACALGEEIDQGLKAENVEERSVAAVSPVLLSVLRDNPRLVQYLTGR